jgi:hypothetical protein
MADPLPRLAPLGAASGACSKVVDLAAYRAAHPQESGILRSIPPVSGRPVSRRAAAHREVMLRYLATQTLRVAVGRRD